MVKRQGASTLGCLVPLLLVALVIYLGRDFGAAYVRYYRFQDAMAQDVRYVGERSEDSIVSHLRLVADSLDLPAGARSVRLAHTPKGLLVWSDYDEDINLPFNHEKVIHFHATSETSF